MVREARLEAQESGLAPAEEGWFVVNVRDAAWYRNEVTGGGVWFESERAPFSEYGVNIRVLQPGQPNGLYHAEDIQEDFLVLAGECRVLVEGEERLLGPWDFVHFPPNTEHIAVGAGDGPAVVLMIGTRKPGHRIFYPVWELARRHGAGVERETESPGEAYAGYPDDDARRPDGWDALPWSAGAT